MVSGVERRLRVYIDLESPAGARRPAVTVTLEAGGAGTDNQRAIPGPERGQSSRPRICGFLAQGGGRLGAMRLLPFTAAVLRWRTGAAREEGLPGPAGAVGYAMTAVQPVKAGGVAGAVVQVPVFS